MPKTSAKTETPQKPPRPPSKTTKAVYCGSWHKTYDLRCTRPDGHAGKHRAYRNREPRLVEWA